MYSLYFALAAFSGLGDNDFYIASVPEACVMAAYLLFNLLLAAYILGGCDTHTHINTNKYTHKLHSYGHATT